MDHAKAKENLKVFEVCFRTALGKSAKDALGGFGYGPARGWDSVSHISLITELESNFGIELTQEDITRITDLPDDQRRPRRSRQRVWRLDPPPCWNLLAGTVPVSRHSRNPAADRRSAPWLGVAATPS